MATVATGASSLMWEAPRSASVSAARLRKCGRLCRNGTRSEPSQILSSTDRSGHRLSSCATMARPRSCACLGVARLAGAPSISTRPWSGRYTPVKILTSVLLPAPFSPQMPRISPAPMSSDTSLSAAIGPKLFEMWRTPKIEAAAPSADGPVPIGAPPGAVVGSPTRTETPPVIRAQPFASQPTLSLDCCANQRDNDQRYSGDLHRRQRLMENDDAETGRDDRVRVRQDRSQHRPDHRYGD